MAFNQTAYPGPKIRIKVDASLASRGDSIDHWGNEVDALKSRGASTTPVNRVTQETVNRVTTRVTANGSAIPVPRPAVMLAIDDKVLLQQRHLPSDPYNSSNA